MGDAVGRLFVEAIAARDHDRLAALLADDVDFRGLTPGRSWEASSPAEVVGVVLGHWFGESDHVEAVQRLEEADPVEDTYRVGYRLVVTNPDGPHLVEQQMYYRTHDGRIDFARVVCSGYRRRGAGA
jgi:hypothetical protein